MRQSYQIDPANQTGLFCQVVQERQANQEQQTHQSRQTDQGWSADQKHQAREG